MTTETNRDWEPTRHGGLRRSRTRVAQKMGTASEAMEQTRGTAVPDVEAKVDTRSTLVERHSEKVEVGGSNPSPRTKKFIFAMNERLGLESCPYVIRWRFETPWASIRLHHWLGPDDDRARHDHPWSFVTFVLKGGYTDISPAGDQHLKAPTIQYRDAEHQHTVVPDKGGAWTVIITGPKIRKWGFWVNEKFVKMNKYFLTYGHHPCD